MSITIALVGNPNCGKTTVFNVLTGSNQYVGNWPGVTVEKKEGTLKNDSNITLTDLPGIYSLSPYTLEEVVSRNYLINERPDAILNIIDGTNIERNLYLTTQLIELGIPVVLAINMMDVVERRGDHIQCKRLSDTLGCTVVEISALKGRGLNTAVRKAAEAARQKQSITPLSIFSPRVEGAVKAISSRLGNDIPMEKRRFFAIKLFERDSRIDELLPKTPDVEALIRSLENEMDDDSESIIINERYLYIDNVIRTSVIKKNYNHVTTSDKIDSILTNRWLAIPIFVLVMFCVYFISITTVGNLATDWANNGVFGDGWHFLGIGSSEYDEASKEYDSNLKKLEVYISAVVDREDATLAIETLSGNLPDESEQSQRGLAVIRDIIERSKTEELTAEYMDGNEPSIITYDEFMTALTVDKPDPSDYGIWIPGVPALIGSMLKTLGTETWLNALILDGIIGGVGSVLGFIPQLLILFLMLAILEDCGYMSRVAFIMDRLFCKFGLSGKSFIPMLIGSGCSVPGIMASRTIENESDRRMTIITTSFIPCGAKMPIIALVASTFFGGAWWVAPSAYFMGVSAVVMSGIILKRTRIFSGDAAPFVMELPAYHMPTVSNVFRSTWERGWSFIKKAGTIIMVSSILIWILSNLGFENGSFGMVSNLDHSIVAYIGSAIAWIFAPLGFGSWKASVASLMGLLAKEEIVSVFGVLSSGVSGGAAELAGDNLLGEPNALLSTFTSLSAYSFLIFNLLCAPCFAAIGAIRREMGSAKWTWFAIGYQCTFAYIISFLIYQLGLLFTTGAFSIMSVIAIAFLLTLFYLLFYKNSVYGVAKHSRA